MKRHFFFQRKPVTGQKQKHRNANLAEQTKIHFKINAVNNMIDRDIRANSDRVGKQVMDQHQYDGNPF
ncbi:hypothetical protein D3C71_2042920 [compost metagenome]